ncbi:MAG TPA: LptF/LptG family permease, partial [Thermoanaerobaculia bacterium]
MSILTRYILREMIGPTILGFSFYTSIILMQKLFDMAGLIIRRSLSIEIVGQLLMLSLPHIVVLTVPMALLFGILIAVGRLSSDSEIVAMRALGISTRTIYRPVFLVSLLMFFLNLYLINVVMPKGNRQFVQLRAEIMTSSAENEIKPRVFYDEYENLMIYVNDVDPLSGQWKGVFVSDSRIDPSATGASVRNTNPTGPESNDISALTSQSGGQRIIVAGSGNLSVMKDTKDVWLNLRQAQTHYWDPRKTERYDLNTNESQRIRLPTDLGGEVAMGSLARSLREMNLRELVEQERKLRDTEDQVTYNLARVEIHKKFAIPFACIAFGVLGLPLGITNRRGGKSSGFSLSIAIILFYYVMINNGEHLASAGKVPPVVAMWAANLLLLGLGIYLLSRANREFATQREGGFIKRGILALQARRSARATERGHVVEEGSVLNRLDITFPNIIDRYILREFLKVLGMVLISVIALFVIVDYTDLAKDVRENKIAASTLIRYYRFQAFYILNWTLPISVLVATLVTFGMLSKNNEVTAIKSGGVSLYRVALPILFVAAIISLLAYFILDFVLPYSNQRAMEIRNRIEGRTPKIAASAEKLWYRGQGRYLINFVNYDEDAKRLSQVQVFEFHPTEFRITRRVRAESATWNGQA